MKIVDLSTEPLSLKDLLELVGQENLILRTPDGREFVLAEINDSDKEVELVRQNQELMDFLDQRSREEKTYTLSQVRKSLGLQ
jgi:hypothetical protein